MRVGGTVRRQTGHWTPAVHALLAHLQSTGFSDAPAVLGTDGLGREILPFVVGEVGNFDPGPLPGWFRTPDACMAIGDWLRRCHAAQRGFAPDPALPWRTAAGRPLAAGEVVVHHDVGPYNAIRRPDGGPTVIDWDFCAPGDPIEDLAFVCWSWAPLWNDRAAVGRWFGDASVQASATRLASVLDGYGAAEADRARLLPAIQAKMAAHSDGLEALAARGDPVAVRLFESGVAAGARRDADWVHRHRAPLSVAIGGRPAT
jgi:Ser/Thr protein kinase RdoA (MazF antagonist)